MKRKPDLVIGGYERPYLLRWYMIPKNRVFNVYLHKFCRSDDDRALHDHPWLFNVSILLTGAYIEETPASKNWPNDMTRKRIRRRRFIPYFRWGKAPHRVELLRAFDAAHQFNVQGLRPSDEMPVWTIFITGPRMREWGFYCPNGWRWWRTYTQDKPGLSEVGRGCE